MLGVDPKILGDCAVEAATGPSLGLLTPRLNPPRLLDGAAVDVLVAADEWVPRPPKRLLACCCGGLLPNNTDVPPALVLGGGPAGVVEFPKKFVVGLLVGVVVVG